MGCGLFGSENPSQKCVLFAYGPPGPSGLVPLVLRVWAGSVLRVGLSRRPAPFQLAFDRKCTCKSKFKCKFHFKQIANEHVNAHATGHEHENANSNAVTIHMEMHLHIEMEMHM